MLFNILKIPARIAIYFYCRDISVNNKNMFSLKGPLLIAANHPNSFLDAIILATLFDKPIYSLARGDAFKNNFLSKILFSLNILPVYRISEGAENLNSNYDTFSKCREVFKKNGIVLIFSEGLCINEWKLRPLKKGTARLTLSSWREGINLRVLPIGINYQCFRTFGKNIQIKTGNFIDKADFDFNNADGLFIKEFNKKLESELKELVLEIDKENKEKIKQSFHVRQSDVKKMILSFPAFIGRIIHAPLYIPVRSLSLKKAAPYDHYDSVLVGLLLILYPLYLSIIAFLLFLIFGGWYWLLTFLILPFFAWSFVQIKKQ